MSEVVARCFLELSGRRAHALEGRSTREEDPGRRAALHASPAARRPLWRCCRAAFKTECQTCQSQTTRIRNLSDGTARRGMRVVESSSRTQAVQVAPGLMIDHFSPRTRQPHSRSRRCASRMLRTNPPGSPLAFQVRCRAERPEELSSHARPAPLTHCVPPRGGTRRVRGVVRQLLVALDAANPAAADVRAEFLATAPLETHPESSRDPGWFVSIAAP